MELDTIVKTENSEIGYSLEKLGIIARGRMTELINKPAHFHHLWKLHDPNNNPPSIDFDKYSVVFAYMGQQPYQGYEIEIIGVDNSEEGLHVCIREDDRKSPLAAQSNPLHMIKIDKNDGPITRITREEYFHYADFDEEDDK